MGAFILYLLVNTIKRSFLSGRGGSNTPSLGYFTSHLYNNPVLRDLDCLAIQQDSILIHFIDDTRLIGTEEQEVVKIPVYLNKTHVCQVVGPQTSGLADSVKFPGIL